MADQNLLRDATRPANAAWISAIFGRIALEAGSPELSAVLGMLAARLPQYVADLEAEGYVIPPQLVLAP
jgi:hypothetical protein